MSSTPERISILAVMAGKEQHHPVLSCTRQQRQQHQRQTESETEREEGRERADRLHGAHRDGEQGHQEGAGTGQRQGAQEHAVDERL